MRYTKYTYLLPEEEFYHLLIQYTKGVEVIERRENSVVFATYEELSGLRPIRVEEIRVKPSETKPIKVGSFLVLPPSLKTIFINPGMAFGTGLHPSTKLSLMLIQNFFKKGWSAIDVGCGSGILAIALRKLKAKKVLAIDIDKTAVEECKKNALANRVRILCKEGKPEDIKESFDFLVANLEIEIFKREMENLLRLFTKRAVFSGIHKREELREFLETLKGVKVIKIRTLKDWYGVAVER